MKNRKWIKLLLVILALVVLGVVFSYSFKETESETGTDSDTVIATEEVLNVTEDYETEEQEKTLLCVHVCGEVTNPGVYYLESGARIHEAVSLAGGLTDAADANYINMAEEVTDGEQIYIPSRDEVENGTYSAVYSEDSNDGLVNINTGTVSDFMTLPGIGQVKAEAIVNYRNANGRFNSIEDLKNVSGIGDNLFEEIKEKIKV